MKPNACYSDNSKEDIRSSWKKGAELPFSKRKKMSCNSSDTAPKRRSCGRKYVKVSGYLCAKAKKAELHVRMLRSEMEEM